MGPFVFYKMIKWYSEILHILRADLSNLLTEHEVHSSGLHSALHCCITCTSGACPEATSHVPCLESRSVTPASLQKVPAHIGFPPAAIPRPVVPSCVSTREFQTLGFQEFVRLWRDTRNLAYAICMPCRPFLWSLRSVWEFHTREDMWSEITWAHTGISRAFNLIIVLNNSTKTIQQPGLDHGKLLSSDMNFLCHLIFRATNKRNFTKDSF